MMPFRAVTVLGLLVAAVGWSGVAGAAPCYIDAKADGTGLPIKWPTIPITYKINATKVDTASKDSFVQAVRDAFATWEQVECTNIKFTDGGLETTATSAKGLGIILVYFDDSDNGTLYSFSGNIAQYDPPDVSDATMVLKLNATVGTTTFHLSVGAQQNKFDIQTLVKNLIPMSLGFCAQVAKQVGQTYCVIPDAELKSNYQNLSIIADEVTGAQYSYFKTGGSCVQPTKPEACANKAPVVHDASVVTGDGTSGKKDGGSIVTADGKAGDAKLPTPSGDSGCCRVGYTTNQGSTGLLALAGLALLLALRRRRR